MQIDRDHGRKTGAALIVLALHGLLGYALLTGFQHTALRVIEVRLKVFDLPEPPPPPLPKPRPAERPSPAPEAAASPADLKADPTPVVAPPAMIEVPSPIVAAPEPLPVPDGNEADAGSSTREGPGSGAGGEGAGRGSGGQGSGTGGGGATRAQRVSGSLLDSDYPRQALRMGIEGSVRVRFTVTEDGRVTRCTILETSGFALLDQTTCRLAERRFRYRPALDASGRPVPQDEVRTYDWWLPERRR